MEEKGWGGRATRTAAAESPAPSLRTDEALSRHTIPGVPRGPSTIHSGGLLTDPNKGEMIEEALEPIMDKYFALLKESMARYRGVRRRCSTRPTTPESQGGGSQGESRESNGEGGEAAEMMLEGRAMVVREKSLRHSRSGRLPKDQSMAAAYSRLGFCGVEREGQSVSISVPTRSRRR